MVGVKLDDELAKYVEIIRLEVENMNHLHKQGQVTKLANSLSRIESAARIAGYCIIDIADLAG